MSQPPPVKSPVNPTARWAPHKVAAQSVAAPTAPPDAHADRAVYGLMQPILGARMLFTDRELFRASLVPAALAFVPIIGHVVIKMVVAVWALHWIVVDAFDAARVLQPGQTVQDLDVLADKAPRPWFVRLLAEGQPLPVIGRILIRFARW